MKTMGKIKSYNGKYGTIITENKEEIDFEFKDISFKQTLSSGDIVEFRVEKKFPNIKLAKNISLAIGKDIS